MNGAKIKPKQPAYKLWMHPTAHAERKKLPGNVRQRIKRMIENLVNNPVPSSSRELHFIQSDC